MRFPFSWLKNYVDVTASPHQIAKLLTQAGIEVEGLEKPPLGFEKVVVGQVLKKLPHPNADKLCVAEVSDGQNIFQVVCGAPNCREGLKTAFAPVGASVTLDGAAIKIKKTKIRGVESLGMLCSAAELGVSAEDEGIIEFADHLTLGADVAEIYADTLFEVGLTPNMNHAASMVGVARELSALTQSAFKSPLIYLNEGSKEVKESIEVEVNEEEACPIYSARVVEGITNGESPVWLKQRLISSGVRPINLAADVSNYVLLEMGQPLHVFDLDRIHAKKIEVRKAYEGESLLCLDGKERVLNKEMLVIAVGKRPLALAGIIGGEDSSVTAETSNVLIEAAYFNPSFIRRTSKLLGVSTDSSKHFERGVDPEAVTVALDRAAMLLQELGGGTPLKNKIHLHFKSFERPPVELRIKRIDQILGTHLSFSEVEAILQRLHFKTEGSGAETLQVYIPSFRRDVNTEIDLIEEVARLKGYDNLPRKAASHVTSPLSDNPLFTFERRVRSKLIAEGLQEFVTCDLIGPSLLEIAKDPSVPPESIVKVMNPTSIEQSMLRTSLLQGLLQVVKFNVDHQNVDIHGFEIGRVHFRSEENFQEPLAAALILSGSNHPYHIDPKPREVDFFDLKGLIENLFKGLNIKRYAFKNGALNTLHPGRQALILVDGVEVGSMGEVHPEVQRKLDVKQRIYFAEVNLSNLLGAAKGDLQMKKIPLFPGSERAWTVTVREDLPISRVLSSVEHIPSSLLKEVTLQDIFTGKPLASDQKNVTLHFKYRDDQKTVSQEEVNQEHARIIAAAEHMLFFSTQES